MTTTDVLAIITSVDGGFNGLHPTKQISVTPVSDTEASYVLTGREIREDGTLGEIRSIERFQVTVTALPPVEGDPEPVPEPVDPLVAAITEIETQLPPEGSADPIAEVSVPATRIVLDAARR